MSTAARCPIARFDPRASEYILDPQAVLQGYYVESPIVFCEPLDAYFILGYDEARQALRDAETYSSHAYKGLPVREDLRDRIPEAWERVGQVIQGGQLINMDGPTHVTQRRAMQQTFTPKRAASAEPVIEAVVDELIDRLEPDASCDLMKDFALQLTVRVVGTMLALPDDMIPGFLTWIGDVFAVLAPLELRPEDVSIPDEELVATFERLHGAYVVYTELLDDRRASPGQDLASAMLGLTDDGGQPLLSTDEVLAHMVGITAAGTDTTAALIVNTVRHFTQCPSQLAIVRETPQLWENAIQEGLRRPGIVLQLLRVSTRESEIGQVTIPHGSNVFVGLAAANSDPAKFSDPLRFDVRRDNAGEHLSFGLGRHYCMGAPLAPSEARIALERLYQRLPKLEADLDQALEFVPSPVARVPLSQKVAW